MTKVHKTALVRCPADLLFELVDGIEAYPQFLPWCRASRVLKRAEDVVEAELEIARGAIRQTFATRNFNQPGRAIRMTLLHGPFSHLEGAWWFQPLREDASRITLDLEFEMASRLGGLAFGPVFNRICETLVGAFIRQARSRYG